MNWNDGTEDYNKIHRLGAELAQARAQIAALTQERDEYKRALLNHLCVHDMADWVGCSFDHQPGTCAVCAEDGDDQHWHAYVKRAERAESTLAQIRALPTTWRQQGAQYDTVHATMGSGWKACADDLDAVLAPRSESTA